MSCYMWAPWWKWSLLKMELVGTRPIIGFSWCHNLSHVLNVLLVIWYEKVNNQLAMIPCLSLIYQSRLSLGCSYSRLKNGLKKSSKIPSSMPRLQLDGSFQSKHHYDSYWQSCFDLHVPLPLTAECIEVPMFESINIINVYMCLVLVLSIQSEWLTNSWLNSFTDCAWPIHNLNSALLI